MITSILINIAVQFGFFCAFYMIISPITAVLYEKGADQLGNSLRNILYKISLVTNAILGFPIVIFQFIILLITGNRPRFKWDKGLRIVYSGTKIYNLLGKSGFFLYLISHPLYGIALIGSSLYFLLPKTFASLCEGFAGWAKLINEPMCLDLLKNGFAKVLDIVKERLIIGGFNESPILFIILALLSIFVFSNFDFKFQSYHLSTIPSVLFVITVFNFIYGFISFESYTSLSASINSIAMIWVLVFLMYTVCNLLFVFFNKVVPLIFKK